MHLSNNQTAHGNSNEDFEAVLSAASEWKHRCLLADGSLLSEKRLWSIENLRHMHQYFVLNPIEGNKPFLDKLKMQLESAPPSVQQLASELFFVLYLYPVAGFMLPGTKRMQIKQIWEWSGETFPADAPILEALESGIGNPGTAYHTLRWRELRFLIAMLLEWKSLASAERKELLEDGWAFGRWLDLIKESKGRSLRHMLLYMFFPDLYSHTSAMSYKNEMLRAFLEDPDNHDLSVDYSDPLSVDKALHEVHMRAREKYGQEIGGFWEEPLRSVWDKQQNAIGQSEHVTSESLSKLESWYRSQFGDHRVWAIGAGEGARLWPVFRENGLIAIGMKELSDLSLYPSKEAFSEALREAGEGPNPVNDTLACYEFVYVMKPGDYVIAKKGRSELLGLGRVTSEYMYRPDEYEYANIREIEWERTGRWPLSKDDWITNKTLTDFSNYEQWLRKAISLMRGEEQPQLNSASSVYTQEMAMEDLFLSPDRFTEILDALGRKKNVILEGPPGVGKTFIAKRLAWLLLGKRDDERVSMVQFHQSYAYEDFIQGWRPTETGGFELRNGPFHEFCLLAQEEIGKPYVFIIDEINRANLSKVFGELMMLIESDKRREEFAIPLTYSRSRSDLFYVPDNVHILGLMNTADRSLAMVDYALRRRFAFVRLEPEFRSDSFSNVLLKAGAEEDLVERIITRMSDLNEQIRGDQNRLGPGFEIGHSFFCPQEEDSDIDDEWYRRIVKNEIEPLIREYWFDDPGKILDIVKDLLA